VAVYGDHALFAALPGCCWGHYGFLRGHAQSAVSRVLDAICSRVSTMCDVETKLSRHPLITVGDGNVLLFPYVQMFLSWRAMCCTWMRVDGALQRLRARSPGGALFDCSAVRITR